MRSAARRRRRGRRATIPALRRNRRRRASPRHNQAVGRLPMRCVGPAKRTSAQRRGHERTHASRADARGVVAGLVDTHKFVKTVAMLDAGVEPRIGSFALERSCGLGYVSRDTRGTKGPEPMQDARKSFRQSFGRMAGILLATLTVSAANAQMGPSGPPAVGVM